MNTSRLQLILVVFSALFVFGFLFTNTVGSGRGEHSEIIDSLRNIRQIDASINQSVLMAHFELHHNYTPLSMARRELQSAVQQLRAGPFGNYANKEHHIDKKLIELEDAVQKKMFMLEDFKTDNALVKNSLQLLPHALHEFKFSTVTKVDPRISKQLDDFTRDILTYNITRDANLANSLYNKMNSLRSKKNQFKPSEFVRLSHLLNHAALILEQRDYLDNIQNSLLNAPLKGVSSELQNLYLQFYGRTLKQDSFYYYLLFLFSIVLLCYIVFILLRLHRSARDLFNEKERALVTLHSIGDAVITTDANGVINYINPVAEHLTGWHTNDASGQPLRRVFNVVDENNFESTVERINECLKHNRNTTISDNALLIHKEGEKFAIKESAAPIRDRNNKVIGSIVVFHDVTEARAMARELEWQASHDALTGLANRREFERRVESAIVSARQRDLKHTLLYVDLDQFKIVNDTCGHIAGDELLRQVAAALKERLRSVDTLSRLGGDEFGILLESCPKPEAIIIGEEFLSALHEFRFRWKKNVFTIGGCIGLVEIDHMCEGVEHMLRAADVACYAAKDSGRNRLHVYQHDDEELAKRHGEMQWTTRITRALEDNRFILYQQKIEPISAGKKTQHHHEILLRLIDENGDIVPPGAFIPAAERYDKMQAVDRWVVREVVTNLEQFGEGNNAIYAINLSGQSVSDESFLNYVVNELSRNDSPVERICFEITETAAISNLGRAMRFIKTLKGMGAHFALDDFGMGLSSFAYLKNLPVDYLKIDGSFVKDIADDPLDLAMVEAINRIGHLTGIKTIAEFVESAVILESLRELKVDYAQGYYIGRPEPLVYRTAAGQSRMGRGG